MASAQLHLEHPTLEQVLPSFASAHLLGEPWVEPEDVSNAILSLLPTRAVTSPGPRSPSTWVISQSDSAPVRQDRRITLLARGATTELSGLSAETDATVRSGKD